MDDPCPWSEERFNQLIEAISTKLNPLDLQVTSTIDDLTGRKMWLIVRIRVTSNQIRAEAVYLSLT